MKSPESSSRFAGMTIPISISIPISRFAGMARSYPPCFAGGSASFREDPWQERRLPKPPALQPAKAEEAKPVVLVETRNKAPASGCAEESRLRAAVVM